MSVGISELLIILVIALIVIKPDKLGEYAKSAGEFVRKFKEGKDGVMQDVAPLKETVDEVKDDMNVVKTDISLK